MDDHKDMYDCPLLNHPLWMGDCYDINAVIERMVKRSILQSLESELGIQVDLSRAEKVCPNCYHYNFKL
ncbi:hypothetical protein BC351_40510 [Paenibacillus ferrarius]|uniref:Uncharacterized protein n=1 Tax=Paenibacillus ferrarius TaxID=1469647 RepID=A0A1V4H749_9BACL|nr:hypothetical protein BC351_40510 [Paenibacillus ferrarius]